ncbi:MAG: hypothetical protein EAZ60_21810 [Oscillatoriales cyanobacterium]|nr:MAG: hypothetical protein EAZ83_09425 [Oscillatoriales cyanobacterium]TAE94728.1 MAG: hypothetical protein EAZ79_21710 [Oscillatoriales cyanobacterium]TAF20706.1 MAG: hypothetical protein EAZ73_11220 [Oscillatoriales cyanobacterium]TAF36875.1 MAG: hypothetical protein EAZ69_09225 [Oscillatoriales cyanobacterium]TAF52992.1 MAG: hypothetical protein EAZ60_21810 [Oscillatoriales cyanobacterium]
MKVTCIFYLLGGLSKMKLILNPSPTIDTRPYWKHLWRTAISPRFHWLFLEARFKANFMNESIYRRIITILFIIFLIAGAILTQSFFKFVLAIIFPLTFLYHIASLLQFLSEHKWGSTHNKTTKSHGRFCGVTPPTDSSPWAWCYWIIKMLGHFLVRVAVLSGEMPEHDWHHKSPKTQKEWANGTYARQREVEAGKDYIDFWGIGQAIEHVFQGLAKVDCNSDS